MSETGGARVIQVIVTTLLRRGSGKDENSPIRGVTQYWSLDGKLLAEVDPCQAAEDKSGNIRWRADAGQISYFPEGFDPNKDVWFGRYVWTKTP